MNNLRIALAIVALPVLLLSGSSRAQDIYMYPAKGQSQDQQERDRYECHSWAVKQTGFDPSRPGMIVPAAVTIASGNPVGLIVVGGMKIYGEASGRNQLEGRAKATADEIAEQLRIRFHDRGWIS